MNNYPTSCSCCAGALDVPPWESVCQECQWVARCGPLGKILFPFQRQDAQWLSGRKRGLLLHQMGLGKTLMALAALPRPFRLIVVTPAQVKMNWYRKLNDFFPDMNTEMLQGMDGFRWPKDGEALISGWDRVLPTAYDLMFRLPKPVTHGPLVLIADEIQNAKSPKADRTLRFKSLAQYVDRLFALTGTPMMNTPADLYYVADACGLAELAFGSWDNYKRLWNAQWRYVPVKGGKKRRTLVWGKPHPTLPQRLRRIAVGRRRKDVLPELPKRMADEYFVVDLDAKTDKTCTAIFEKLQEMGVDMARVSDITQLTKDKIAFELLARAGEAIAIAKIPALLYLVKKFEEMGEPLVVFSAHTKPVEALGLRDGWHIITGKVQDKKRWQLEEDFQAGKIKYLAGTIKAMGVGLTLTAACHEIFVDLSYSPSDNEQARDRLPRIGQTKTTRVLVMVADHEVDRHKHRLLKVKRKRIESVVERAISA